MTEKRVLPRYPVYIPSKGRADCCYTARSLATGKVPFFLVVEQEEADAYTAQFGVEHILTLPFSNRGLIAARNWIKGHATASGSGERHWQIDDNITYFARRYRATQFRCDPGVALRVCEDFTDRYENIAIAGLNYCMFVPDDKRTVPLVINCHVYSCSLILNALPFMWRSTYNDDTDFCLQVLAHGWCTVLLNTFLVKKMTTMKVKGGNTDTLYQGDGRLRMARSLERMWPGVVETDRRFHRPQHVVKDSWKKFDTPLRLKPGIDLAQLAANPPNEYGMSLVQVTEQIKSPTIQGLLEEWQQTHQQERGERQEEESQEEEEEEEVP